MILLGIGDFGVTSNPGETLKTLGLGSCIAVICTDIQAKVAGMVHIALPDSASHPEKARSLPGYFADTGIAEMFRGFRQLGYLADAGRMQVKLAGGSAIMDAGGTFNIGKRNALAVRKVLWGMGLGATAEDLGGNISRTVAVDVATGTVKLSSPGRADWTI